MQLQKETKKTGPGGKRSYLDACAAAHALDLVGERWALLVIRELMTGPKRFSDLRAGLPGISAKVLTQRLEDLEGVGVVSRRQLPPPASAKVYELTEWGYQSEPIFQELGRWAARSPHHDPTLPFSSASFVLSLRTMFDAERASGLDARIGFRLGAETFTARIRNGELVVEAGDPSGADLVFTGTPPVLAGAIYAGMALDTLVEDGALAIEGDRALAERFLTLFPLPPKYQPGD